MGVCLFGEVLAPNVPDVRALTSSVNSADVQHRSPLPLFEHAVPPSPSYLFPASLALASLADLSAVDVVTDSALSDSQFLQLALTVVQHATGDSFHGGNFVKPAVVKLPGTSN